MTLLMGLFQLPHLGYTLQWDHQAIISGEWWRIVTGNFTHTNLYHLIMNIFGLWIIGFIFRAQLESRSLLLIILGISTAIGSLLLLTDLSLYVGLSGVLHGLFGFYALKEYHSGRQSSLYLVIGLLIKILWEQNFGSPTGTQSLIDAPVALNAHLFGTLSGLILALLTGRKKSPNPMN